jgi:NADH-quinone oxidoreductase subunit L
VRDLQKSTCARIGAEGTTIEVREREGGLSGGALSAIATGVSFGGVAAAGYMYLGAFDWQRRRQHASVFWKAARNKFFVDQAYEFVFVGIGRVVASALTWVVDLKFIDGAVNGLGTGMTALASGARRLQTGLVRTYALGLLGGTVLIGLFLLMRTR